MTNKLQIRKYVKLLILSIILNTHLVIFSNVNNKNMNTHKYTNRLIDELSPYLLQHAHNPVDWYPWGEEALKKAKDENKMIIVSIGYSSCHWCHVMEEESFENETVAKIMNDHFVCIKVDREERPDIDNIYMNAVQLLTGKGGWPLNCICLPDTKPIYGGTYFPKEQWTNLLDTIQAHYSKGSKDLFEQAEKLSKGIASNEFSLVQEEFKTITEEELDEIFTVVNHSFDPVNGGFNKAPKFPMPTALEYMLTYGHLSKNDEVLKSVKLSLKEMAFGGIYDQVGGGFARYSTDEYWRVPHFEKMLYDNAQLVSLYAQSYKKFKEPLYKEVVEGTIEFLEREMMSEDGAFYSALDADTEGEEGKFYVWRYYDFEKLFPNDWEMWADYYNVTQSGNWEQDKNVLYKTKYDAEFAKKYNLAETDFQQKLKEAQNLLFNYREARVKPGLDDKIICSWNAMMLSGYVDAFTAFGEKKYLEKAESLASFLWNKMKNEDGSLHRIYKNSTSKISAFIDDYAFCIEAFVKLYQANFEIKWLKYANELTQYVKENFSDKKSGLFYFNSEKGEKMLVRKISTMDNVIPSGNSVMAKNLLKLSKLLSNSEYEKRAQNMMKHVKNMSMQYGIYYANWDMCFTLDFYQFFEFVVLGLNYMGVSRSVIENYFPNVLFASSSGDSDLEIQKDRYVEGKTMIYVCKNKTCKQPTEDIKEAIKLLNE